MRIILNGIKKEIEEADLKSLIEQSCRDPQRVIAELNGSVIKNHEWNKKILKDGDSLELVNFVGGG